MKTDRRTPLLFAPSPAANRSRTSIASADAVVSKAPSLRQRILAHLADQAGAHGATNEEMARSLSIALQTVTPRVHELGELGLVVALKETRAGSAGVQALVFVAAEHAGGRDLEPWPIPRIDWKSRALAAERRLAELQTTLAKGNP